MECIATIPTGGNCCHSSTIEYNDIRYKFVISQYAGTYSHNINGHNQGNCQKYNITLYNNSLNFIQLDWYKTSAIVQEDYGKFYTMENRVSTHYSDVFRQKIIFNDKFVMINDNNKLNIYDCHTLKLIKTLTTKNEITCIRTSKNGLILEDSVINNHGSGFQSNDIYNWNLEFIKSISMQIMFSENDFVIAFKTWDENYFYNIKKDTFTKIDGSVIDLKDGIIHVYTKQNEIKLLKQKADDIECSICLNNLTETFALVPCGHTNLCTKCYTDQNLKHCPICRKDINMRIKIYK